MTETARRTDTWRTPENPRCETSGKIGYSTEGQARRVLLACLQARAEGRLNRMERAVYQCPTCQRWHLTSRPYVPLAADDLLPLVERLKAKWNR